jgi:hypothetical protein
VLRRLLLAVLLCLSAWAAADRLAPDTAAGVSLAAAAPSGEAPDERQQGDGHWRAPLPLEVHAERVSSTREMHVHVAALPSGSYAERGRLTRLRHTVRRPAPSRPPHLHDTPLLI